MLPLKTLVSDLKGSHLTKSSFRHLTSQSGGKNSNSSRHFNSTYYVLPKASLFSSFSQQPQGTCCLSQERRRCLDKGRPGPQVTEQGLDPSVLWSAPHSISYHSDCSKADTLFPPFFFLLELLNKIFVRPIIETARSQYNNFL